jgi:hypothetical protein
MKTINTSLAFLVLMMSPIISCNKKIKPVSERIAKVWVANLVREGSRVVYDKNAVSNIRMNYTNFLLDLSNSQTVTLREFDNQTFTGQWEVQEDTKLILKNLSPQPTGTSGIIEYSITQLSNNDLKLTRTATSIKTGNTLNNYELINQ